MKTIEYTELTINDIDLSLFSSFDRHQEVEKCWRKENDEWILKDIHITNGNRGNGIGKQLFHLICERAIKSGAKKLYISSHSSKESKAFYDALGCVEATEYNAELVEMEPCDCQLEYLL